jgi:hypothetical protein
MVHRKLKPQEEDLDEDEGEKKTKVKQSLYAGFCVLKRKENQTGTYSVRLLRFSNCRIWILKIYFFFQFKN